MCLTITGDLSDPFFTGKTSSASVKHNECQFVHVLYLASRYIFVSRTQDRLANHLGTQDRLARADSDVCEMILSARRLQCIDANDDNIHINGDGVTCMTAARQLLLLCGTL